MAPGTSQTHDSAALHVSGRAQYCDDIALPANALHAAFGLSPVAHGRVTALDLSAVSASPGVAAIALPADIPGENNYGGAVHDDPIFADKLVQYAGQPLFAVAADSMRAARKAAKCAKLDVTPLPALLDIRAALAAGSYVLPSQTMRRGDARAQLARAPRRLRSTLIIGGQDHFYLEGHIALAIPQEDGGMLLHSSTQHPTEVQSVVAHALGTTANRVVVHCRRMGGGFGGKESQATLIAAAAAILAHKTGRPVKLRLDRDVDMLMTGKRHDFIADYEIGFDDEGRLLALSVMLASRCGYSADLSGPVNDRAMFHVDNAYYLENVEIISHRCKTHTVSNTAFRGFGGPQGMMVIETILDDVARQLGRDPLDVRRVNLYGLKARNTTHYGQVVEGDLLPEIFDRLELSSAYRRRRADIIRWNAAQTYIKRGLALTPVKFGIAFTSTIFNQAGALLQVYTDGTVLLNHGGTEMGQGLHVKVAQIVASELGLPLSAIRISATDTSKVPNTSATAASSGSDLNGRAAQAAAVALRRDASQQLTLFEVLSSRRPPLWVFGAGHVGRSLVRLLSELSLFDITWIDPRSELLPADLPECVTTRFCTAPAELLVAAQSQTRYVVLTHDHALDYELCRLILARNDGSWLGLIGSASKASRFRSRLLRDGVDPQRLADLTCPIGVAGIASKLPAAIAIAIAAQLLQLEAPLADATAGSAAAHACDAACATCAARRRAAT